MQTYVWVDREGQVGGTAVHSPGNWNGKFSSSSVVEVMGTIRGDDGSVERAAIAAMAPILAG